MESVIIIGTGGFAIELAGLLSGAEISVQGFIGPKPSRKSFVKWIGDDEHIKSLSESNNVLIAVGEPELRFKLAKKLSEKRIKQYTFIHPSAYVAPDSVIQEGSIIYPNVTIHTGVILKKNVLVNSNATIGHETKVKEFSNIGPGASIGGCCNIGRKVHIGIGATTVENITITNDVLIGAGATVVSDISTEGVYIGIPAKKIDK
jgi:sugar O-acyltransferase (sialic acid O-acetyltransferase NeuD family)